MKKEMKKEMEREKDEGDMREREHEKRERKGEKDEEAKGKEQTQTRTPNTYALARMTLETIGCLCHGPSRRFQGACRFRTHKKLAQRSDSLVRGSRQVERDQKKKKASRVAFGPHRATGAAGQRLALPSQRHDPLQKLHTGE